MSAMTDIDPAALEQAKVMVVADHLILTYLGHMLLSPDLEADPEAQAEAERVALGVPEHLADVALYRITAQSKIWIDEVGGVDFEQWEVGAKPVMKAFVPPEHLREASIAHGQMCYFYRQPEIRDHEPPLSLPVTGPWLAALHGFAAGAAWLCTLMPDPRRAYLDVAHKRPRLT